MVDCRPNAESARQVKQLGLSSEEEKEDEQGLKSMRETVIKAKMVKFMKGRREAHEKDVLNYPAQKIRMFKVQMDMAKDCLQQLIAQ
jgi:hypothetical protein